MGFTTGQLATASLIGQIGGGVTSAVGSYFSAATQRATLRGQAAVADTNAHIAELGAQSALLQGQQQAGALTLRAGQLKSSQRAAMAANGIDLGEGSAVELQASTDIMKEIDKNTIEANAVRSAWGYRTQAMNFQNEALTKRATAGAISPFGAATSSLLGSAGTVASSWYSLNKAGALKGTIFEG
ncbi:virion core protein, T7 gp14 family [Hydrogenophaga aquatica]